MTGNLKNLYKYTAGIYGRLETLAGRHGIGHYLGIANAGLINLLNPGIVVIGGRVAQRGNLLLEPIRQEVRERSLKTASQPVWIAAAVLGRRSSGIGAVVQAATLLFHHSPDSLQIPEVH